MGIDPNQFVTFRIDDNLLGIDVLRVREINRVLDFTPLQHTPEFVKGLVNLRGETVTVVDLGIRLGFGPRLIGPDSHNIVLKHENVGFLVDSIGVVVGAKEGDIEPPPANSDGIQKRFIDGILKLKKELLVILSTKKLLEEGESMIKGSGAHKKSFENR